MPLSIFEIPSGTPLRTPWPGPLHSTADYRAHPSGRQPDPGGSNSACTTERHSAPTKRAVTVREWKMVNVVAYVETCPLSVARVLRECGSRGHLRRTGYDCGRNSPGSGTFVFRRERTSAAVAFGRILRDQDSAGVNVQQHQSVGSIPVADPEPPSTRSA